MAVVVRSQIEKRLNDIHYNLKRRDIDKIIEIILSEIVSALNRDEAVEIRGVGRWVAKKQKAKMGRNPKNGLPVEIPAKGKVKFKPSKILLKKLNQ